MKAISLAMINVIERAAFDSGIFRRGIRMRKSCSEDLQRRRALIAERLHANPGYQTRYKAGRLLSEIKRRSAQGQSQMVRSLVAAASVKVKREILEQLRSSNPPADQPTRRDQNPAPEKPEIGYPFHSSAAGGRPS
jgi:hypothetical protein